MEVLHCDDFDGKGHELDTVAMIVFNAAGEMWARGEANGYTESAALATGDFEGEALVLRDAQRRGGSLQLTDYRHVIRPTEDGFVVQTRESTDRGESWTTTLEKRFTRREASDEFMRPASEHGRPAPDRPDEAGQFSSAGGTRRTT